jgi:hypothetical protein
LSVLTFRIYTPLVSCCAAIKIFVTTQSLIFFIQYPKKF